MNEFIYYVNIDGERKAKFELLSDAMIFAEAYFEKNYVDPEISIAIVKEEVQDERRD